MTEKLLEADFARGVGGGEPIGQGDRLWLQNYVTLLGALSHQLKCEMKSPHLVDFS